MVGQKVLVVLVLLVVAALAEKKINLEDIERDNLRAESKSSSDNAQPDEPSYAVTDKPEASQQEYQQAPQPYHTDEDSARYAPQRLHEKYALQSEDYPQDVKYVENDVGYQQTSQPVQQYVEYQQQQHQQQHVETVPAKGLSHASTYAAPQQQLVYQQEVEVGNQYQSVQQKAAAEKYLKNSNKDALYVNIPMEQLLSYYPSLALNEASISKGSIQPLLHRLATQAAQQIAIPVYTPTTSSRREPIYAPSRVEYQIQPQYFPYPTKYPQHTEAILPTKQPKKLIYSQSVLSHRQQPQPQPQPQQYLQEIVYAQPAALYAPAVATSHASVYARPTVDLQGNTLGNSLGHSYASHTTHHQQYTPAYSLPTRYYTLQSTATLAPQLSHQIYQHQSSGHQENYETVPESPGSGFDLPRLPAQNFKSSSGIRLVPVNSESFGHHYAQNHLAHSSGPKSLLDSYIPSGIIAAQDAERYRERPIKLERGFLPSKINFVQYKKRKAE